MKLPFHEPAAETRNPKPRNPKEGRNPKSESPSILAKAGLLATLDAAAPEDGRAPGEGETLPVSCRINRHGLVKAVTGRVPAPLRRGFTLLEVMIAIAIFFVASFAILGLISTSLNNVRRLQRPSVDASPLLAHYEATNSLIEGVYQGSLGEPELLGKDYRDYNYVVTIEEVASNHLYAVNCKIFQSYGKHDPISDLTTVLYKPQSPAGSLDGGIGMTGR